MLDFNDFNAAGRRVLIIIIIINYKIHKRNFRMVG